MAIWHVEDRNTSGINLIKTAETTFRVVQFGEFGLLLTGSDYTLIHLKILPAFDTLSIDQLETRSITISRNSTGDTWHDYYELDIKNQLTLEMMKSIDSSGDKVWHYEHTLFVSDSIRNRLKELVPENTLFFSEGFSMFG